MTIDPKTRQQLLELVYDLLAEDEAAELTARIESDPELAQAFADARRTAHVLAEGARIVAKPIPLSPPRQEVVMSQPAQPPKPQPSKSSASKPQPSKPSASKPGKSSGNGRHRPGRRGVTWTVGSVASVLLVLSLGSFWWHHAQLSELASSQIRLVVAGPARYQAGMVNRYTIRTTNVTGAPMSSGVELAIHSPDGKPILQQKDETDDDGRLTVALPADLDVPIGSRLSVVAAHQNKLERMETKLSVDRVRLATQLGMDKPLYQPGETVCFRSLTLGRFGLNVEGEVPVRFKILDPSGAVVPGSASQGITQRGVGNGAFPLPPNAPGGEYTLVAESPSFPEERRTFFVRSYRLPRLKKELEFQRESHAPGETVTADFSALRAENGPAAGAKLHVTATVDDKKVHEADAVASADGTFQVSFALPEKIDVGRGQLVVVVDDGGVKETIAKAIPINLGKVVVEFFPEAGDLAPDLENRVYFTVRDPLGKPADLKGWIVDADDNLIARVETKHEGMGEFSFAPRVGETYQLRIETPKVAQRPRLPDVVSDRSIVLSTGRGVFEPGSPLEFNVRAAKADLPLVAAAWCRGVPVGQEACITEVGANSVSVALADDASGVIRLTIYDYSSNPPTPVAERLVYRRPARRLDVKAAPAAKAYSPGDPVKVNLTVVDESGKPVPEAVLGVAVVDDALLNLADDDDRPSMPTHFLLTTEIDKPEDLEKANFYLSDDPAAPAALDLLLGTQGWRRFVEKTLEELKKEKRDDKRITRLAALGGTAAPPSLFDNLNRIRKNYESSLTKYREDRTKALRALTTITLFVGIGLVLFTAMLSLIRAGGGWRIWGPALGAAAACVLVGAVLMNPDRLGKGSQGAVAFHSFSVEPTAQELRQLGIIDALVRGEGNARKDWFYYGNEAALSAFDMAGQPFWDNVDKKNRWGNVVKGIQDGVLDDNGLALGVRKEERQRNFGLDGAEFYRILPDGQRMQLMMDFAGQPLAGERLVNDDDSLLGGALFGNEPICYPDAEMWKRLGQRKANAKEVKELRQRLERLLKHYRFPVRQYAHKHVVRKPGTRSDFAESLYWNPLLICDREGKATVKFELSDSVTAFRVSADAHGPGGRIGAGGGTVVSRIPFSLEPKLPLEVTAGDRIDLPLAVVNDTEKSLPVEIRFEGNPGVKLAGQPLRKLTLDAGRRSRETFTLDVVGRKGDCGLTFAGTAGTLSDAVERRLRIVPPGFPKSRSFSGRIEGDQEVVVDLPKHWVPGSLEVTLCAFPSTLADLQQGVESMMQEPNGCFEQASTSNYPNVLSLQYLKEHNVAAPAVTRRARDLLKNGYGKLTAYECKERGFEWFGGDPGHEALSAYGLMEFRDMAKVHPVDQLMLGRTANWLLERRDGKGGFKRNDRALDSFGRASEDITNAYITWALAESGQDGIDAEVKHSIAAADKSDDPYLVALAGSTAFRSGKKDEGQRLAKKLAQWQEKDGHLTGKNGSITQSGGHSLNVETTALAALAWLQSPEFTAQANRAIDWITKGRQGEGGFGSTQGTILALKALVEHAKANAVTVSAGSLIVKREDKTIGEFPFQAGRHDTISIDGLEAKLQPGDNRLVVSLTGENKMPYALDVSYRTEKPDSDPACPVRLTTSLAESKVASGQTVALSAKVENTSDKGQPMTVAILGLPAGLEVQPKQLEDLRKAGSIDYYETRRREVIFYWRAMASKRTVALTLDLIAAVPGRYTGPASRVYLYYTAEQKQWTDPMKVEIR